MKGPFFAIAAAFGAAASLHAQQSPSFNREVRPILAGKCFQCHGPDEHARKAGLRLDTREGALAPAESGVPAIVPGDAAISPLLGRISHAYPGERMPPEKAGAPLTAEQVSVLRRWIDAGAEYEAHWSLLPPRRPEPPTVSSPRWVRNPIDSFVLARLVAEGLSPAPEADRRTLIRRLALDLTGIPPTVEEVRTFEADPSPEAYAHLVDRLLGSARHAERMAQEWMDAARYADTNGYHIDNERFMWRWRDWVIEAYRANMPFDRFTVEQLAGDLLPGATLDQKIASGFHRNHMINFEGGAIPEEYLNNYLVDRVNTTATVWLGMTMACAQCHDHKYDPVSQEDYYRFYAFFNSVPERGLDGNTGNSEPFIAAPFPEQREALEARRAAVEEVRTRLDAPMPETDAAQAAWEAEVGEMERGAWHVLAPRAAASSGGAELTIDGDAVVAGGPSPGKDTFELTFAHEGGPVGAVRLEALVPEGAPGPGRFENGNFVLTGVELEAWPTGDEAAVERIAFVAALADYEQPTFDIAGTLDADPETGWAVLNPAGMPSREAWFVPARPVGFDGGTMLRLRLRFDSRHERHAMARVRVSVSTDPERFERLSPCQLSGWKSAGPFPSGVTGSAEAFEFVHGPEEAWTAAGGLDLGAVYLDGAVAWADRPDLRDGIATPTPAPDYSAMYFARTVGTARERVLRLSLGSDDGIKVWVNGKLVHSNPVARALAPNQDMVEVSLPAGESTILVKVVNYQGGCGLYFDRREDHALEAPLAILRDLAAAEGDAARQARLRSFFRERHSPEWKAIREALAGEEAALAAMERQVPTSMVMSRAEMPRPTFILTRGEYDQRGREVTTGVPRVLGSLADEEAPDRLDLARWLVSPGHPLTARVQVNRLWQMLFGTGLVKTAEDFGIQGEWPSHPELLDWLAVEFVESGWDVRHMLRLMVDSAAYRQFAAATAGALAADPEVRLLSRHPRIRLSPEGLRDNALAIAGLLVERVGGPSVKPYQPPGLWEEMAIDPDGSEFSAQVYKQDTGEALYRRGMYVFLKRSVPPPSMQIFDAPSREVCVVRRLRTNTPLQALVLMNDPTYVEAARAFAERILREGGTDDAARVAFALECATARPPTPEESAILLDLLGEQRDHFAADAGGAEALLSVGESARDRSIEPGEHAAWTMVASAILNLDSTICKE